MSQPLGVLLGHEDGQLQDVGGLDHSAGGFDAGWALMDRGQELFLQVDESCALSPRHFVIEDLFGDLIVHDLDSDAGTVVNGRRIARNEDSRVSLLQAGRNDIQLGAPDSPIRFTLVVETL